MIILLTKCVSAKCSLIHPPPPPASAPDVVDKSWSTAFAALNVSSSSFNVLHCVTLVGVISSTRLPRSEKIEKLFPLESVHVPQTVHFMLLVLQMLIIIVNGSLIITDLVVFDSDSTSGYRLRLRHRPGHQDETSSNCPLHLLLRAGKRILISRR